MEQDAWEGEHCMKQCLAEDAKATIVLVHGAFEHSARYEWLAKRWQEEGYNCLYADLPAHGEYDGPQGHIDSFDEYIEEVTTWINQAQHLGKPIFLVGHSMGGLITIRTLEEKQLPIKGVVLSSPCLGLENPPPKIMQQLTKLLARVTPKMKFNGNLNPEHVTRDGAMRERDQQDRLILRKVSVRWFRELDRGMDKAFERIETYPNLPTLVMQAGHDKIVDRTCTKKWYDQLPIHEKNYQEWENLYHEIFNDPEKEDVFQYALRFVEKHIT